MKAGSMGASRAMLAVTLAALAATAVVVACAESDPNPPDLTPDAQRLEAPDSNTSTQDATADASDDVAADAGCDSDPSLCTPVEASCDDVAWCPAKNPADARRAFTAIWGASKNDVWAVGSAGTVIHFDGSEWKLASTDSTRTLYAVTGTGPNDVWIFGTYGSVFHGPVLDGGATTWDSLPIVPYTGSAEKALLGAWTASPDDLWITGESLKIPSASKASTQYRKTVADGGGIAWESIAPCSSCAFTSAVWAPSPSEVWSVGAGGKTFHTTMARPVDDAGADAGDAGPVDAGGAVVAGWFGVDSKTTQDLLAVWGSSKNDVWSVGRRGTIRHWVTDAASWDVVDAKATQDLHAVWGSSKDDIWVVGDYGTILHYDGASWQASTAAFPVGLKPHLYAVWGTAKDDVWIGGEGVVLHYTGAKK